MAEAPVAREVTQAKLDQLAAATLRHRPSQPYTVADRVEEKARAHPTRPFLRFDGSDVDYATVNARANRVAHVLRAAGLAQGQVAALLMENRPEFIVTWIGLAKLGVTVALVNTQLRGDVLAHALATTAARALIVGAECLPALATVPAALATDCPIFVGDDPSAAAPARLPPGARDLDGALAAAADNDLDPSVRTALRAGDDLFHIFTSGTTGLPKAARLSHMRFLGVGDGMSAIAGYGPDDVIACVLPLYHGAGGMVVVSCALAQGAVVALRRRFSASRFWEEARRDGVTACQYVGELCRYLYNAPPTAADRDHRLRVMMGAGLGPDIWRAFQERFGIARILEGWSSTEANTSLINVDGRIGSCGRIPFKERHNGRLIRYDVATDAHPRAAAGRAIECAPGEIGEFIGMILDLPDSGAGRFEGYTSSADTERKILRDVFAPGDRWYRSGDLLVQDGDGYFTFVDRIGDTFRWKSENVSTQEVAEALGAFPSVAIANVYGVPVPGAAGRAGMAALVLRPGATFDGREFFAFSAERLPSYAVPLFVRLVDEPDVTSTFKLKKVRLQEEGYDPRVVSDPLLVRDEAAGTYVALTVERYADVGALVSRSAALTLTDPRAGNYSVRMWRALLAALCLAATAHAAPTPLAVVDADYDAGTVDAGTTLTHRYELRNDGARPLTLTVKPECGCTTTQFDPVVPAGGTGSITAALDVKEMRGRITKHIRVTTDDTEQPALVLSITADVHRALDVLPSDRPVVRGPLGAFQPIELTVAAPDDVPFRILDVEHDELVAAKVEPLGPSLYRVTLTPKQDLAVGSYSPKVTLLTTRPKAERFALHPSLVVDGPLVVTPSHLRLGAGSDPRRVRVSSARPDVRFHLLSVASSDADLAATLAPVDDGRAWDVNVTYSGAPGRRPLNAILTIKTDVPLQPVLLVRVMGEP